MEISHLLVRKNPNSSHVWDLFVGLNWGLMFVLVMMCELVYRCLRVFCQNFIRPVTVF